MSPEQAVKLHGLQNIRETVRKYMTDNAGWRAEDRDLVWSHRYVAAKLSLLHSQQMNFGALVEIVRQTLSESSSERIRLLTPSSIAESICEPSTSLI